MRLSDTVVIFLALLTLPAVAWPKGETTRIEIAGGDLASPIEINDPAIVSKFSIWNGPGVSTSGPDGVPHPPAYLDPNRSAGRFIDWPKGIVKERPASLRRYQVTFQIAGPVNSEGSFENYRFLYEFGPHSELGFMYLPDFSDVELRNGLIYHGVEGNWFYSSESWETLVRPVIEASNGESGKSTE